MPLGSKLAMAQYVAMLMVTIILPTMPLGSKLLIAQYVAMLNGHNNLANHAPGVQIGNAPVCSNVTWSQ